MNDLRYWTYFGIAFMIVLAVLTIAAAIQEWLEWRKEVRKDR